MKIYLDNCCLNRPFDDQTVQSIRESEELLEKANSLNQMGLRKIDSLHIACAVFSKCEYLLTTDDKILKRANEIGDVIPNGDTDWTKTYLSKKSVNEP